MRHLISVALLAWYVGFTAPDPDQTGLTMWLTIGPFKTKIECEHYRNTYMVQLLQSMPNGTLTSCAESQKL